MSKYILDFDKIQTIEDIKIVLQLLATTIAMSDKYVLTQLALEKIPDLQRLCTPKIG